MHMGSIKKESGLKTKNTVKGLHPVLNGWIDLVVSYSNSFKGDACYWYNERCTLSTLAGAAWRSHNWVALEEFSTQKASRKVDSESGNAKNGRCDIKIASPSTSFAIEVKQAWQPVGNRVRDEFGYVTDALKKAKNDARELKREIASQRLAGVFVVPNIRTNEIEKKAASEGVSADQVCTEMIDAWCKRLVKKVNPNAYAYVFPKRTRLLSGWNGERIYPGVVLLLVMIPRGYGQVGRKT